MTKKRAKGKASKRQEWRPDNTVSSPLEPGLGEVITCGEPADCPCCYEEPTDVNACSYETTGPRETAVVTRGDINRLMLETVLPVAAQACEEGQLREKQQEREYQRQASTTYWCVQIGRDTYETTSALPHGMPALRWHGSFNEVWWMYCLHLQKYRIARGEAARKIAREATFMLAGNGVQT